MVKLVVSKLEMTQYTEEELSTLRKGERFDYIGRKKLVGEGITEEFKVEHDELGVKVMKICDEMRPLPIIVKIEDDSVLDDSFIVDHIYPESDPAGIFEIVLYRFDHEANSTRTEQVDLPTAVLLTDRFEKVEKAGIAGTRHAGGLWQLPVDLSDENTAVADIIESSFSIEILAKHGRIKGHPKSSNENIEEKSGDPRNVIIRTIEKQKAALASIISENNKTPKLSSVVRHQFQIIARLVGRDFHQTLFYAFQYLKLQSISGGHGYVSNIIRENNPVHNKAYNGHNWPA